MRPTGGSRPATSGTLTRLPSSPGQFGGPPTTEDDPGRRVSVRARSLLRDPQTPPPTPRHHDQAAGVDMVVAPVDLRVQPDLATRRDDVEAIHDRLAEVGTLPDRREVHHDRVLD